MDIPKNEEIIFYQNLITLFIPKEIVPSRADNLVNLRALCIFFNHTLEALNELNEIPELIHSSLAISSDSSKTPPSSF
jgi:hypothetical protein